MANEVTISGVESAKAYLAAEVKKITEGVQDAADAHAKAVEQKAKSRAPAGLGSTIRRETNTQGDEIQMPISAGHGLEVPEEAAYLDFGTGQFVELADPSLKEYAYTFFVSGLGRLPATNFLTGPFIEEKERYIRSVKDLINKIG